MSKKSRRRNKKILGALAAGLGAMALMRGRNKGAVSTEGQTPPIGGTDHIPSVNKNYVAKNTNKYGKGEFLNKINDKNTAESGMQFVTPYVPKPKNRFKGNLVPPSMRGGADYAEGASTYVPSNRHWPGGYVKGTRGNFFKKGGRAGHKSGGRVGCGKAKRGFGRALKKGK